VTKARTSVTLVSPFLSFDIAAAIADRATLSPATDLRMITAIDGELVGSAYLDVRGLRVLANAGFQLRSIPNLHAKVTLVDRAWCLVGSGNLTSSGLGGGARANVELGVVLNQRLTKEADQLVEQWWSDAKEIEPAHLEVLEKQQVTRPRGRGLVVGEPLPVPRDRVVEASRAVREPSRTTRQHWVKAMYYDEATDRPRWWTKATWINDRHLPPVGGGQVRRRPGYRKDDLIVLYLKEPQACPAIYEVVKEPAYRPKFVARYAPGDEDRWGWVTKVRVVASIRDINDAPGLSVTGKTGRALQNGFVRLSDEAFDQARRAIAP
jgi:hypothetical protein